jgi:23S rRNA pseudouridine2605 synthase
MPNTHTQKLQKVLATYGLGSRRMMEQWICQRRVSVNGEVADVGRRVALNDVISVDGKTLSSLSSNNPLEILMYHKPRGEVCTRSDPENRPTVFEGLPQPSKGRWILVGRLDVNTSGLLLFTNNGEWANKLMHPSFHLEREYLVRVYGVVTPEKLEQLKQGVELQDGPANFNTITPITIKGMTNVWFKVTISQGRNRIVRRLWASQGLKVNRLSRTRFGCLTMPEDMQMSEYRLLSSVELHKIKAEVKSSQTEQR